MNMNTAPEHYQVDKQVLEPLYSIFAEDPSKYIAENLTEENARMISAALNQSLNDRQIVLVNWMYNFCLTHMLCDQVKYDERDKQLLAEAIQRRFPTESAAILESTLYLPKHP